MRRRVTPPAAWAALAGVAVALAAAALVLTAAPTPPRHADAWRGGGHGRLASAKHAAWLYWQREPCGGGYSVRTARLPAALNGNASYLGGGGQAVTQCQIVLARAVFGAGRHAPFALLCAVITHEIGHLLQFREVNGPDGGLHSSNPRNVMFPVASDANVPAACRRPQPRGDRVRITPRRQ